MAVPVCGSDGGSGGWAICGTLNYWVFDLICIRLVFLLIATAIVKLKHLQPHSIIISLFAHLHFWGIRPDRHSLGILANSYCHLGRIDFGFSLLGKQIKVGYPPDCVTLTTLINGYINNDKLPLAAQLLDKIVGLGFEPDIVTYGAMFKGLCRIGDNAGALDLLERMQSGGRWIAPNAVTYNTLIDGLCKTNRLTLARQLFTDMQAHGVTPDVVTYNSLLDGLCKSKQLDEAVALLEDMEDKGIRPDIVTYNILMDSLCEAGQLEDAAKFFSDLVSKGLQPRIRTYNILVKGFCKKGLMKEADEVLRKMEEDSCLPNAITYNMVIRGYILSNDFTKALYYHDLMLSKGFEANADTFTLFIDLLSSDKVVVPPLSSITRWPEELGRALDKRHSWGMLANSYSHLGRIDFGFSLLRKSLKLGYPPDHIFFASSSFYRCLNWDCNMDKKEGMQATGISNSPYYGSMCA
uniref:Pentatricopeptide repeat-containing protein n=1 Tax=Chenopodium quinoa TaxID=63459 RepID=A0A803KMZ5_CHEQI